jgi:predicted branched-subunit amino acid permease
VGLWIGAAIPDPERWGLEFTLPLTFIAILVPLVRGRSVIVCVLTAAVASLMLNGLPNKLGLVASALIGVAAGTMAALLEQRGGVANGQEPKSSRASSVEQARN